MTSPEDASADNRRRQQRLVLERQHRASQATLTVRSHAYGCAILNFSACGLCLECPEDPDMAIGDPAILSTSHGEAGGEAGTIVHKTVALRWRMPTADGMILGLEFEGDDSRATDSLLTSLSQGVRQHDQITGMDWMEA